MFEINRVRRPEAEACLLERMVGSPKSNQSFQHPTLEVLALSIERLPTNTHAAVVVVSRVTQPVLVALFTHVEDCSFVLGAY